MAQALLKFFRPFPAGVEELPEMRTPFFSIRYATRKGVLLSIATAGYRSLRF
jgi:hypothetical protein